jgi:hypothetical protein
MIKFFGFLIFILTYTATVVLGIDREFIRFPLEGKEVHRSILTAPVWRSGALDDGHYLLYVRANGRRAVRDLAKTLKFKMDRGLGKPIDEFGMEAIFILDLWHESSDTKSCIVDQRIHQYPNQRHR